MSTVTVAFEGKAADLIGAVDQIDGKLGGLEKRSSRTGDVLKGMLAAEVITAGAKKIGAAIGDAWSTVQDQEKLAAQTAAAIKSTGGAANVSADHVKNLANSIEGMSTTEAEAIHQGGNLLLTFTNIKNAAGKGNDIFDQTTQTMVDMAQAMGTDPKNAAMTLGKALNDPIKGLSALGRVGIQFTDQQKDQIKAMQEAGDTAGAQKLILAELNKQFGGSAAANANTFSGALFQIEDALMGAAEEILTNMMPTIKDMAMWVSENLPRALDVLGEKFTQLQTWLAPVVSAIGSFIGWMRDNPEVVAAFGITIGVLGGAIALVTAAQWLWNLAMAANPIGLIVITIALLVAAIVWLVVNFDLVKAKAVEVWDKMWSATKNAFSGMVGSVRDGIGSAVSWVAGLPGRARDALGTLAGTLWTAATNAGSRFVAGIRDKATEAISWLTGLPGRAKSAVGDLSSLLFSAGADMLRGLMRGLDSMVGQALDKARNLASALADTAKSALGIASPSRVFMEIGRQTGAGLVVGLDGAQASVQDAGRGLIDGISAGVDQGVNVLNPIALPLRGGGAPAGAGAPITINIQMLDPTPQSARLIVDAVRDAQRTGVLR